MRFIFIMVVLSLGGMLTSMFKNHAQSILPSKAVVSNTHSGQAFLSYVSAISAYAQSHPDFVGHVSDDELAAAGQSFAAKFLQHPINSISNLSDGGRSVTVAAQLTPGALAYLKKNTQGDASFGIADDTNRWQSIAKDSSALDLDINIPMGYVVYIKHINK